ncbi:TPA: restriction endonuclease subunit S [Enterobacter kobei]|uniref:Type-1 restriction enzyme specificity protein MPN_089 n=1 Tax=Phytobacter massiliensis TaxID=1485952 RepID=A0A6N3F0U9_9ENTR|nr:restriction endonuclease subunit S [Enterobacter kobei]MCK7215397.1 restriction endonuclease subunit S [Enterobacter kobei]HDZ8320232.1 restriction endonuclease subunit S [Enterobacter kobei]
MSELTYLEKLLDGVAVDWKSLGEVAKYIRGLTYSKSNESADGQGYRVLRANNITLSSNCLNLNDVKVVKFDTKVKCSQKLYKDDILISAASGSREHVGKVAYIESDIDYYFGGFMGVIRCDEKLNPRYLFHVLTSDIFQKYLDEMLNSSTINNLNSAVMGRFKIPIPCPNKPDKSLAIQSEIVRILDKFTALTAELTAELTMRKKQYNYYRDQLLSFDEGEVEWKTLGEVATFRRGTAITQKQTTPGDIPVVANGPTPTYFHSESNRQDETIVIARSGAYAGYVSFWNQPIFLTDAFSVHPNLKIVKPKFLYYVLQNKQEHIHAMKKGAGVPHVRVKEFESYDVPIPPLAEQVRIVTILDKFDTLTNSITEGLPREIELRQKQYEYYRDMLLSFPKQEVAEA